jgi:WD40 repeat protein
MTVVARQAEPAAAPGFSDGPYKGLARFEDTDVDALLFFGREHERELISANLLAARLTLLYGPSGVGKSSLLRAGVANHLGTQARENVRAHGHPDFATVVFDAWSDDPVAGLSAAVRDALTEQFGSALLDEVEGESLADRFGRWAELLACDVLVVLDQAEEYFLYHAEEDGFAAELPELVTRPGLPVHVLLAIREDAVARLDRFKGRIPNLFGNYLRVERLDRAAATAAIMGPLERWNALVAPNAPVAIEPALVAALLEQTAAGKVDLGNTGRGQAPGEAADGRIEAAYLQLVLARLWDEERAAGSSTLRLETLQRLGGAEAIVRGHLERALAALVPRERDVAAHMFRHLVTPSGTKLAHTGRDLAVYAAIDEAAVRPVLDALAHERILRPLEEGYDGGAQYEIFHDVLAGAVLAWTQGHETESRIEAERRAAQRRHRRMLLVAAVALVGLAAMTAIAVYALAQRSEAQHQADAAHASAQAALAQRQRADEKAAEAETQRKKAVKAKANAESATKKAKKSAAEAKEAEQREAAAKQEAVEQADVAQQNELEAEQATAAQAAAKQDAEEQRDVARRQKQAAERSADRAKAATHRERLAKAKAKKQARLAQAAAMAERALVLLAVNPQESVRLALLAVRRATSEPIEDALRRALIESHERALLPTGGPVNDAVYSPSGKRVLTASDDGNARIYRVSGRSRLLLRLRQGSAVNEARFSRDGALVVTAGEGGSARIWNSRSGALLQRLRHGGPVVSAEFSDDGRRVITASDDHTVRIWDVATGALVSTTSFGGRVHGARFSPDGDLAVVVKEDEAEHFQSALIDARRGGVLHELDARGATSGSFSPDGQLVVTTDNDRNARLWNPRTGALLKTLPQPDGSVLDADFSPDGTRLVTASKGGASIVWNVRTGAQLYVLTGPTNPILTASFSPNGRFVVLASRDGTASVYRLDLNGFKAAVLAGHLDSVTRAAFSPDSERVLTASEDRTARVWDAGVANQLRPLGSHDGAVETAVYSPDGSLVASAGDDGAARIWRVRGHKLLQTLRHDHGKVTSVVFSLDGKAIATVGADDGTIRVWALGRDAPVRTLALDQPLIADLSPDGSRVLIGSRTGAVRVVRVRDGSVLASFQTDAPLLTAAFSPDARLVATGDAQGTARLWSAAGTPLHTLRGHTGKIQRVSFSPDGRLLATAGADKTARLWDVRTGASRHVLKGHDDAVGDVEFSHDGKLLVTASSDYDARIWQVSTGKLVHVLRAHFGEVRQASFSRDGRWVVTAGPTTAGLWPTSTGRLLAFLRGPTGRVTSASFGPDSRHILASSVDGTVRTYDCAVCSGRHTLMRIAEALLDQLRSARR